MLAPSQKVVGGIVHFGYAHMGVGVIKNPTFVVSDNLL